MATLPTKTFSELVQTIAAGVQGRASALVDFAIGSVLRSIAEGFSSVVLWLQGLILKVLLLTRAATSTGADLDSWMADYGLTRLPAQAATGLVTFTRFTAGPSAPFIAIGSQVRTGDGTQTFQVVADPANTAYSAALGGYTMPAGLTTLTVPVQALAAGTQGNVVAGAVTQMLSPLTGVDTVSNPAAFTNGIDGESDPQFRERFQAYILGLSRGDLYGLDYAVDALQVGAQKTVTEFKNRDGSQHWGYFYVTADDCSGAPSADFIQDVTDATHSVRPLGVMCSVFAPNLFEASVVMVLQVAAGYDKQIVISQVKATVANGINGLGLGIGLPFTQLSAWAYSVAGVIGVSQVTLNGQAGDAASIPADPNRTIKVGGAGVVVSAA